MAKKLTADEMKWILSIDATEAQQAYRELEKDSRKLASTNKSLRDKMNDLIAAGKKNSDEYKRLDAEIKKNNTTLGQNKMKMAALEKTMGITNLTMSQLRKRAKDLQRQLDNTSQATHPEVYKKLDAELATVRQRMDELKVAGKNTQDVLSNSNSIIGKGSIAVALGNIYAKTVQWVAEKVAEIKEFINEGTVKAGLQQGIQEAFKRIGSADDLKNLRKETKNLVSDFELMRAAVRADNFDIPLGKLGGLLAFAHQRAKDTGESVEYLVNSIVDGIGRKSILILDNLGISASRLNAEVKKTGDFSGAVAKIVEEEMAKTGESIETAADIAAKKAVALENLQVALGGRFVKLKERWDAMTTTMIENLSKLVEVQRSHKDQYADQIKKVADLEVNTGSLILRYESLKEKTQLTKDEQVELSRVINSLRSTVPGIATEFDNYGNIMSINTQKVWDFIDAEKAKLKLMNQSAIAEQTEELRKYQKELELVEKYLSSGKKDVLVQTSPTTWNYREMDISDEERQKYEDDVKRLKESILGTNKWIEDMNGTSLENQIKTQKEITEKRQEFNQMTQAQLEEYIKINKDASDKYTDIASEIYKNKFGSGVKPELEKKDVSNEMQSLENKHAKELAVLKKHKMENLETEETYNAKIYALDIKHQEKRLALLSKFRSQTKDQEILVNIDKQIADAETKKLEAQQKSQDLALTLLRKNRDKSLQEQTESAQKAQIELEKSLATQQITKEQYDAMQLVLDSSAADNRLAILQQYQSDVQSLELASGSLREEAIKEANTQVLKADLDAAKARSAQQLKLQDLVKDFKSEFKLTTVDEDIEAQLKVLESYYQARKEMALDAGMDILELEKAFEDAKTKILLDGEKQREQIKDKYGLLTMQEKQQIELDELEKNRKDGLLSEEEYQDALTNLRIGGLEAYFKYYKNLVSGAITALQDAELANIDAKYDVEIERAQGNADEVSRLENEKEQKKLDVQKKYANVNFAIKASEIIANTAVAIVKALSELGPIAGPIAAALMGATGAAQLAVANAERKKIMNMTVSGSSSGSSNTGKRVVTGKESGGFIAVSRAQDGKPFNAELDPDKRGYIDKPTVIVGEGPAGKSREWVASNAALENPTVAPIIQLLNESQEKGEIRTVDMNQIMRKRLAGFESGGSISAPVQQIDTPINTTPAGYILTAEDRRVIEKFIQQLKKGVMAYVLRSELNKEAELVEKSQKIGSK